MIGNAGAIALSGMLAASTRADVAASNIANARSVGTIEAGEATDQPYLPLGVETKARADGGTVAVVRPILPATTPAYDPDASTADANGFVASPNVDMLEQVTSLIEAEHAFAASAAVYSTQSDMMRALYDLGD